MRYKIKIERAKLTAIVLMILVSMISLGCSMQANTPGSNNVVAFGQQVTVDEATLHQMEQEVFELTNQKRIDNGLTPFEWSETSYGLASLRSTELTQVYSHTRPDGRSCFTVFDDANIKYYVAAENIAMGQESAHHVVEAWFNSEGHRANILGSCSHLTVGITSTPHGFTFVQLFHTPNEG